MSARRPNLSLGAKTQNYLLIANNHECVERCLGATPYESGNQKRPGQTDNEEGQREFERERSHGSQALLPENR